MRFRITWLDRERGYLLAEQLDQGNIELGARSCLGPIVLRPLLGQPRALDDAGRLRADLFVFHAAERRDVTLVAVGDVVDLVDG
jgi:hypothetical protein